jgi:hypothetical protein
MNIRANWAAIERRILLLLLVSVLGVSGAMAQDAASSEKNRPVLASEVPERVMMTVQAHRPGLYITAINRQLWDNDQTYYVFYGSQVGKYWVLTVRADGVLKKMDEEGEPPSRRR